MKAFAVRLRVVSRDDRGVGLIEIVISLFLLALLAMSFFPVLVNGMKTSGLNARVATASQFVGQQIDIVRTLSNNCAAVAAFDDTAVAPVADSRGNNFQPYRLVGVCPSSYPGVVKVSAWVTEVGQTHHLADATTLVYLASAAAPTP